MSTPNHCSHTDCHNLQATPEARLTTFTQKIASNETCCVVTLVEEHKVLETLKESHPHPVGYASKILDIMMVVFASEAKSDFHPLRDFLWQKGVFDFSPLKEARAEDTTIVHRALYILLKSGVRLAYQIIYSQYPHHITLDDLRYTAGQLLADEMGLLITYFQEQNPELSTEIKEALQEVQKDSRTPVSSDIFPGWFSTCVVL